jgi:hypothetical protein
MPNDKTPEPTNKELVDNVAEKTKPTTNGAAFQQMIADLKNRRTGHTLAQQQGFGTPDSGNKYQPDVQIAPPPTSADTTIPRDVRPASKVDLRNLDESKIMDLPFISAKGLDVPAMLDLRPVEDNIRFRWVNYKNYEGGNYAMFKAIGFTNATPKDVQGSVSEHLLKAEDGCIKWFDVVLMKIEVLHLMSLYKQNIVSALQKTGRWQATALAQAKATFEHDVGADVLNELERREQKVEFYAPSQEEMKSQDKSY